MIKVLIHENYICISGHAGYGVPGADIVCAAVSILTQNLIQSVKELTVDEIESDLCSGCALIRYKSYSEKMKILIDSFCIGVRMIGEEYPENVRVEFEDI